MSDKSGKNALRIREHSSFSNQSHDKLSVMIHEWNRKLNIYDNSNFQFFLWTELYKFLKRFVKKTKNTTNARSEFVHKNHSTFHKKLSSQFSIQFGHIMQFDAHTKADVVDIHVQWLPIHWRKNSPNKNIIKSPRDTSTIYVRNVLKSPAFACSINISFKLVFYTLIFMYYSNLGCAL